MIRVWFNHWFSTAYQLIELMKEDKEEEIYVIGSNQQVHSIIQKVCDEWYEEPQLDGEEYVNYCLKFCKEHKIDVFVPRKKMADISKNIDKFTNNHVSIMADNYSILNLLQNKASSYDYLKNLEGVPIPDYYTVNTCNEFVQAYTSLKLKYKEVCVKFVRDEGGMSFRKIVDNTHINNKNKFEKLRNYPRFEISVKEYIEILKSAEPFDTIIVMPYLSGYEISVDCLNTQNGLIAIPREKGNFRQERIFYPKDLLKIVQVIMENLKLEYPCNIQFKYLDNIPYLLEINPRMSGGLQMSCLAAKVNIPNIALNKLLGKSIFWKQHKEETFVSYIELPDIVN